MNFVATVLGTPLLKSIENYDRPEYEIKFFNTKNVPWRADRFQCEGPERSAEQYEGRGTNFIDNRL